MSGNVRTLPQVGIVTSAQAIALRTFCSTVTQAILAAREAQVMDGLIVSVLHGHAHAQTQIMLSETAE